MWDHDDNWAGMSSPAERRKRQNRLSQRAYRRRRHAQRCNALISDENREPPSTATIRPVDSACAQACDEELPHRGGLQSDAAHDTLGHLLILSPEAREKAVEFTHQALVNYSLHLHKPSDLPTLARINVLNALANNALALGIPIKDLQSETCTSPFTFQGPEQPGTVDRSLSAPACLRPTALQRIVPHHPWLDVFPIPAMRDNILLGVERGLVDEDELCGDMMSTEDAGGDAPAPIVVWGESWDVRSWELSASFWRKWGWLVQGCPEALEATNFWREKRGEMKISFLLN
ncbi:hypothetical protein NKR23_g7811 [Pleurostoma richardsiae]|uniref:BZIP domain-containing protein n=1 Tax=Pleurostoma richardsiae TaxID=41990 RepID=A0AA38RVB6_9PEZI|nr:hypothetical protein NKR23_g7811 [Pleurostoma richardsiae]